MRGNCKHEVGWSEVTYKFEWENDIPKRTTLFRPSVSVANDEDPHYHQTFETAAELDEFIQQLADARQQAFGHGMPVQWQLVPTEDRL